MNQPTTCKLICISATEKKKKKIKQTSGFWGAACFLNLCSYCERQKTESRKGGSDLYSWEPLSHRDQGLCQRSSRRSCGGGLKPKWTTPGFAGYYYLYSSEWESLVVNCPPAVSGPAGKIQMNSCSHRDVPFEVCDTHFAVLLFSTRGNFPLWEGPGDTSPAVLPSVPTEDQKLQERCLWLGLNGFYASDTMCSYYHSVPFRFLTHLTKWDKNSETSEILSSLGSMNMKTCYHS